MSSGWQAAQEIPSALAVLAAAQLRPLRPPLGIDAAPELPLALSLASLLLLVALGAWLLFRWLRTRRLAATPAAIAERELQRLMGLGLVEQGRLKEHYEILSGCLRRYAAAEYRVPALALTPLELAAELTPESQDPRFTDYLGNVLATGDLVRFDHTSRTAEQARADVMSALEMVRARPPAQTTERVDGTRPAPVGIESRQVSSRGERSNGGRG